MFSIKTAVIPFMLLFIASAPAFALPDKNEKAPGAAARTAPDAGRGVSARGDGAHIDDDEAVSFFPSYGCFDASAGQWASTIHGWIREPDDGEKFRSLIQAGFETFTKETVRDEEEFWSRARPFASDNERGKRLVIALGDETFRAPPSTRGGRITGRIHLTRAAADRLKDEDGWISYEAAAKDGRVFHGRVQLIPPTGCSVISDIDDTIKISEIYKGAARVATNTFNRPARACPGMAALFQKLKRDYNPSFHYVSGSPWRLFSFIEIFREANGFPPGSFHMKEFRVNPTSSEFWRLFHPDGTIDMKKTAIGAAIEHFPGRQFILIGDSGEHDPEIYSLVADAHPGRIQAVYIRNVTGEAMDNDRMKNAFDRHAFNVWLIDMDTGALERRD